MCDAITAMTAVGVAGNVASSVATYRAGRYNAKVSEEQAARERETAEINAKRHRREVRLTIGRQRAQYGASGVTMEGTPTVILADTAAEGELDAKIIERGGRLRAEALEDQADADRYTANVGAVTGVLGAGRTVLTGYGAAKASNENGSDPTALERLFD